MTLGMLARAQKIKQSSSIQRCHRLYCDYKFGFRPTETNGFL